MVELITGQTSKCTRMGRHNSQRTRRSAVKCRGDTGDDEKLHERLITGVSWSALPALYFVVKLVCGTSTETGSRMGEFLILSVEGL